MHVGMNGQNEDGWMNGWMMVPVRVSSIITPLFVSSCLKFDDPRMTN